MNIGNYERGVKKTLKIQQQLIKRAIERYFSKPEMMLAAPNNDNDIAVLAAKEADLP